MRANGEIDIENCQRFGDALAAGAAAHRTVHVDLGAVGYMDSSGLRSLLAAKATAEAGGGSFDVIAASSIVTRLLDSTGLTG